MAKQTGILLNRSVCCFIGNPVGQEPLLYEILGREVAPAEQELVIAPQAYKNNKGAGAGAPTLPGSKNLFLTIQNEEKIFGLAGVDTQEGLLTVFEESVMLAMLNESAPAFEKYEIIPL